MSNLSQRQRGVGRGEGRDMMLIALYLSLGRRAAANSSSQVCKLSLLASKRSNEVELNIKKSHLCKNNLNK